MKRPAFVLLCAFLILVWPGRQCLAQYYYDIDPLEEAMMEAEALTEALDYFDLDLDSPELEGMDGGDIWSYIEYLQREEAHKCIIKTENESIIIDKPETTE